MTNPTHPPAAPGSFSRAGVALVCAGVVLLMDGGILLLLNPPSYVFWLIDLGLLLVAAGILGMVLLPEPRPRAQVLGLPDYHRGSRTHRPGVREFREPVEYVLPVEEMPHITPTASGSPSWSLPASMTRPLGAMAASEGLDRSAPASARPENPAPSPLPPAAFSAEEWEAVPSHREVHGPSPVAVGPTASVVPALLTSGGGKTPTASPPAYTPLAARLSEVPNPPSSPRGSFATNLSCSACGTSLGGMIVPPMCWGCGRLLCNGCYWHPVGNGTAHHCPTCSTNAPSATPTFALSGGRAGRA